MSSEWLERKLCELIDAVIPFLKGDRVLAIKDKCVYTVDTKGAEEEKPKCQKQSKRPITELAFNFPVVLDNPTFRDAWQEWVTHCTELKKKLTQTGVDHQLKHLARMGLCRACAAIENSITKGWVGIYEPKQEESAAYVKRGTKTAEDYR